MHTCYLTAKGSEIPVFCRVCPEPFLPPYHRKGMFPRLQGTIKLKAVSRLLGRTPLLQARSAQAESPVCRHISTFPIVAALTLHFSLSHSIFSSICLHCSLKKAFLPLCYFWNSDSNGYLFPFFLCFSLLFFSQQFVRPPQTTILLFCISFLKEVNTATIGKRRCACKWDSLLGQNVLANKMFCQGVWTQP